MAEEPRFGDWDQIESRITVLNWPDEPASELVDAIVGLVSFQIANVEASPLDWEGGRLLVWRGYLTGGVLTLYSRLAGVCDDYGLTVILADPRVEILVQGGSDDAYVTGVFRTPKRFGRDHLHELIDRANTGADFVRSVLAQELSVEQAEIIESARAADAHREPGLGRSPPEVIADVLPGEINWAVLEECHIEHTEEFSPDDVLIESLVTMKLGPWRTELHPPGMGEETNNPYAESLCWRVVQYKWTAPNAGDVERASDWILRGRTRATLLQVLEYLPPDVRRWAVDRTRAAIADAEETAFGDDTDAIQAAREALATEVGQAEARGWLV